MKSLCYGATVCVLSAAGACVPSGNAGSQDAGFAFAPARPRVLPEADAIKTVFVDHFDRPAHSAQPGAADGGRVLSAPAEIDPGPDWAPTLPNLWH
ncbi:MAG: hypothetical protein ACREJ3_09150, partial [Polyangiaceae bacterium]